LINYVTEYPATYCEGYDFRCKGTESVTDDFPDLASGKCRFTLIGDALVPDNFIQKVREACWGSCYYRYGHVMTEQDIFGASFLEELKPHERQVLMHVVLLLLSRQEFPLHVETAAGSDIAVKVGSKS
jgi:hypothetical protein